MALFENQNTETPTETTYTCKQCNGPVKPHWSKITNRKDTTFCCDDHRRAWREANPLPYKLNGVEPQPKPKEMKTNSPVDEVFKPTPINVPAGLDANAQFIIGMISRERDRFEDLYKREREKRENIWSEKYKLEKEYEQYKYQQQVDAIANAKPTGLSGLGENPLVMKLIDHVGPALGKLAERMVDQPAALAGTGGENPALQFAQWLATKTPETQAYVLKMLGALMQTKDEGELNQRIAQIQNLVMDDYMRATG